MMLWLVNIFLSIAVTTQLLYLYTDLKPIIKIKCSSKLFYHVEKVFYLLVVSFVFLKAFMLEAYTFNILDTLVSLIVFLLLQHKISSFNIF